MLVLKVLSYFRPSTHAQFSHTTSTMCRTTVMQLGDRLEEGENDGKFYNLHPRKRSRLYSRGSDNTALIGKLWCFGEVVF